MCIPACIAWGSRYAPRPVSCVQCLRCVPQVSLASAVLVQVAGSGWTTTSEASRWLL